jgi:hypothetical protein
MDRNAQRLQVSAAEHMSVTTLVDARASSLAMLSRGALLMLSLSAFGCAQYTQIISAKVEDPRRVAVAARVADGDVKLVLPASDAVTEAPISDDGRVNRARDGSLTFRGDHPWAEPQTPLTGGGDLVVYGRSGVDVLRSDRSDFRVLYTYSTKVTVAHGVPHGPAFGAVLATPWSNVVEVRERKTMDRGGGVVLMVLGAVVTTLGGTALAAGAADSDASVRPSLFIGGGGLVLGGIVLGTLGAIRLFSSDEERVVYERPR